MTIATTTCPLRPLVIANPEAAAVDRGMWAGLLEAHLPRSGSGSVTCDARGCLDCDASCRVVLRVNHENRTRRSRRELVPLPHRRRRHDRRRRLPGIREHDADGSIGLVGAEPHPPYTDRR